MPRRLRAARGEPAYLTEATGSGSTLRLALATRDRTPALFVNCRTSLVSEVRDRYGDVFGYEGAPVIVLPRNLRAQVQAVRHVAWLALTYHLRRKSR